MKIKSFISIMAVTALAIISIPSCQDLDQHFEGGTMDDEQIQAAVEALPERINSAVSGMYAILGQPDGYFKRGTSARADDFGYPCIALGQDLNSGDMINIVSDYDWFTVALEWSDRTPTYANPTIRLGLFYRVLYATKDVLSAIPDDTDNDELKAKRGQAKAIRAFSYLSLAPYFQFKYKGNEDKPSIPLIKEGIDPRNNPRAPLSELYENIITDLTDAIADLEGYVRPNKGIIDQQIAYGLRARAYLYMEEWAKAAEDAGKALAGYTPYTRDELNSPGFYSANDHNWMWALLLPADIIDGAPDPLASWPSQLGSFSGYSYVAYAGIYRSINVLLWKKIPATDVRKAWWIDENKTSPYLEGLTWKDEEKNITYTGQEIVDASIADVKAPMDKYANVKFGQRKGIGTPYNEGDWCMMRAEEMILIQAEATAKAGNLPGGKQILENFVKTYRNPAYTSTAAAADAFSDEVWLQRRIELWGEGFAMADIMRLGKNVVRFHSGDTGSNVPEDYRFNVSASDPWILLRFVQGETTNNKAMVNNEGGTQPKQGDGASLLDGVTD
jgi:hypothetical protein